MGKELVEQIRQGAERYSSLPEPARAGQQAATLALIDRLGLMPDPGLSTVRVQPDQLSRDATLRGAVRMHLDLVFRSSMSADEVLFAATRGILRVAQHPGLPGFPVGVAAALPALGKVANRFQLFADDGPALAGAPIVTLFALATNPPRLGGGALLLSDVMGDCRKLSPMPRVIAFSPLTGLRARLIRSLDDPAMWEQSGAHAVDEADLRRQLEDLLSKDVLPAPIPEPARSWLAEQAREFAASHAYGVGRFHVAMGANLSGVCDGADPADSDAMGARAYFDYGTGTGTIAMRRRRPPTAH